MKSANRLLPAALLALFVLAGCQESNTLYDFDGDGSLDQDDCNTADPQIYPGAPDGYGDDVDSNCDGSDGVDGDGYPANADADAPERDCNDSDASSHPGASDPVDPTAADSNCDGADGVDADGDGWASEASGGNDCDDADPSLTQAEDIDLDGISDCDGDCLDTDADVYPGADEVCDGLDNDCDGTVPADESDGDGDGHALCDDCDDTDPSVFGLDADTDGFSPCTGDCNEANPAMFPGAVDIPGDGIDQNCDGVDGTDGDGDGSAGDIDPSDPDWDCDDAAPLLSPFHDSDGDGASSCKDCDDADAAAFPGNAELCDGIDNDCDGSVDEGFDADADWFFTGADSGCVATYTTTDCNDNDPDINPGPTEVCDSIDNDCNSATDENEDLDGDGYSVICDGDCDDGDPNSVVAGQQVVTQDGSTFLSICAGTFEMGCTAGQSSCHSRETPVHSVTLTNDFWMSETEVTQGQWQAVMGNNPSYFSLCGTDCPVEMLNWWEALAFANAVSSAEGLAECYNTAGSSVSINSPTGSSYDCEGYRLPTEAEWEYAARAGTDLRYAGSNTVGDVAWYDGNSGSMTHAVATKAANAWGLYDMSGNVWEWTWDLYGSGYYSSSPNADPEGPSSGSAFARVVRGGGWLYIAGDSRVANRSYDAPDFRSFNLGFRLSRTIP